MDTKPDQALVVPNTVASYQAILDNTFSSNAGYPILGEAATDNYYLLTTSWSGLSVPSQNVYIWAKNEFPPGTIVGDWNNCYSRIYQANLVLDGLEEKLQSENSTFEYKNLKGQALFYRALNYHQLALIFCKPYTTNAILDLGLPIRLHSNVNDKAERSTLEEIYQQIIGDLTEAQNLLPDTSVYKTRPSKVATKSLLARVYLSMNDFDKALLYSNESLNIYKKLIDYSTLSSTSFPIPIYNSEVIFHAELSITGTGGSIFSTQNNYIVDTTLYRSYATDDLRKSIFFNAAGTSYKGSYVGNTTLFGGIATDELYLMRAECYARKGNISAAMQDLNDLLRARWRRNSSGTTLYVDQIATDSNDALNMILNERRKELIFRGLRWVDLRRLNTLDPKITILRQINNQTYILSPNDTRYVYSIPQDEINLSGIQQNQR